MNTAQYTNKKAYRSVLIERFKNALPNNLFSVGSKFRAILYIPTTNILYNCTMSEGLL